MPLVACPDCGAPTRRAWLSKAAAIVGDEMDHVQVNGLREPRRFRSKQEHKRWLKEAGYEIRDGHAPMPGTDKSKHGISWATMDPQTLENARYLVTHRQMIDAEEPDEPLHIRWVNPNTGEPEGERA